MKEFDWPEEMGDNLGGVIVIELLGGIVFFFGVLYMFQIPIAWPLG